jgi:hypothetical protein
MYDDLSRETESLGIEIGDAINTILGRAHTEALLDGLALIGAFMDDDPVRAEQVMIMMDEPQLVAAKLAKMIAESFRDAGVARSTLADLQRRAALGET